jgi:hypothetical protein
MTESSFGSKAVTAALIHFTAAGRTDDMVRTVSVGSNTPPPTSVQPGR